MKRFSVTLVLIVLTGSAAAAGDSPWTLRFHGALVESSAHRDGATTGGTASRVEVGAGGGIDLAVEYRFSDRIGLEVSALLAALNIDMTFSAGTSGVVESLDLNMVPFTLGVPIHFGTGGRTDFYLGPTLSYVSYVNISSSVSFQTSRSSVDVGSDIALGAALGLDVSLGSRGWAFSTGLRYMKTAAGQTDIDPLIVSIGFAYRF